MLFIAYASFICHSFWYYLNLITLDKRLEQHEQADQHIVDLAESMARAIGYIEDVEQFARASQLKRAIEEVRPLIEETANFIVSYTSRSATGNFGY